MINEMVRTSSTGISAVARTKEVCGRSLTPQSLLTMSLKKQIKDLQKALGEKDSEAASLRRHIKMTSLEEIKVELQIYVAECQRLRSLLDEIMNNQRDAVELDKGDPDKQTATLRTLKRENSELANQCRMREDEIGRLSGTVEELNKALAGAKQRAHTSPDAKLKLRENAKEIEDLKKEVDRLKKSAAETEEQQPKKDDSYLARRTEEAESIAN